MTGGGVARDHAPTPGRWQTAEIGDELFLGDGVRTDAASAATLALVDGNQLQLQPSTLVRFLTEEGDGDAQRIEVETGSAVISIEEEQLRLRTELGTALFRRGTRVRLSTEQQRRRYEVELGSAHFVGGDRTVDLQAGDSYEIDIGKAVVRRAGEVADTPAPEAPSAPAADAGASTTTADAAAQDETAPIDADDFEGEVSSLPDHGFEPSLERYNVELGRDRSVTIHAPEVPIAVAFDVKSSCKDEAIVQVGARGPRYRGRGSLALPLDAGTHRYAIRCLDDGRVARKAALTGRVSVLRDAGTRKLPRKAPTSRVEADGRNYNVYYQNQPPNIIVRWPRAPSSKTYMLVVDGKPKTITSAEYAFASGTLSDGNHQVHFAAAGRRSRNATIDVRFDNRAPTASISSPPDRSFTAGQPVNVSGVAAAGWKVSAEGGTLDMDAAHRFQGQIVTTAERPDVALRLWHPRLGTHYYLRRSAQSP